MSMCTQTIFFSLCIYTSADCMKRVSLPVTCIGREYDNVVEAHAMVWYELES